MNETLSAIYCTRVPRGTLLYTPLDLPLSSQRIEIFNKSKVFADPKMSQLEKLLILGVRSFDNTKGESIRFQTPLTLIVGPNGSGKTTIIECLKYAATGELPPNSRGGAFIHDPKIAGEKEVMAQVKMMFTSTAKSTEIVTRSLQLTVKKNSRSTKTLPGQLTSNKNGERSVISSRVAELDSIVPDHLGVSRAVLESVIFCHQDESLWPLSEPLSLKKKFDEIFEAQKYTKAIANIKDIRKEQANNLKVLKERELAAKNTKVQAEKAEKKSSALDDDLQVLRKEIAELNDNVKDAADKLKHAYDQVSKFQKVLDSLTLNKEKFSFHQKNINKLKANLKERLESDEWLQSELEDDDQRAKSRQDQQMQFRNKFNDLGEAVQRNRDRLGQKQAEVGRFQSQKAEHENQIEHRKKLIQDTSKRYNIRGYEKGLTDEKVNEFMSKIRNLSQERNNLVEKARKKTEDENKECQEALNGFYEQRTTMITEQKSSKQQIAANENKIKAYNSEIANMGLDESEMTIIDAKMDGVKDSLSQDRQRFQDACWDKKLQELDARLRALREQATALNDEMFGSTKHMQEFAELSGLEKQLGDRQRNIEKMKSVHANKVKALLNNDWRLESLESDFEKVVKDKGQQITGAEHQRTSVSNKLEQLDAEVERTQSNLRSGKMEMEQCEKKLREVLDGEPDGYHTELAGVQNDRDTLKAAVDGHEYVRDYYQRALETAERSHKCKLCSTNFSDVQQQQFVGFMRRKLDKDEDFIQDRNDYGNRDQLLTRMRELGPVYESWKKLREIELPKLGDSLKAFSGKRATVVHKLEEHDQLVNQLELSKADIDAIAKPVANIIKHHAEIHQLSNQIAAFKERQKNTDLPRSVDEVSQHLKAVNNEVNEKSKEKDKLSSSRDKARTKINNKELELRDAKGELEKIKQSLKEKDNKAKIVAELRDNNQEYRTKGNHIDVELSKLSPQIDAFNAKLEDIKTRASQKEKSLRDEANQLNNSTHKLEQAEQSIRRYIEEGGGSRLDRAEREAQSIQQEIRQLEEEKNETVKSVNKLGEELRSQEDTRRNIRDNLEYRTSLRELEALRTEIAEQEAQNVKADRDHWEREGTRWSQARDKFSTEKTSKVTLAREKDDQLAGFIKEWETDFKYAKEEYRRKHIEVETTKAAVEDLGTYGGALDKAIMRYHSVKMEEINRIIEELWKKTYQGTDVDTIMIRSDNETAKGNRSYNYRVAMVKQDAEMDMRGRCSAGQKVLASIIIRLALAECFGLNCGLIALDEPTTNLDQDNIKALARSLHDLIQNRRLQSNFQLVVITHDEEFLREMKCPDFCDQYYRVGRDEREKSRIYLQSINDVM